VVAGLSHGWCAQWLQAWVTGDVHSGCRPESQGMCTVVAGLSHGWCAQWLQAWVMGDVHSGYRLQHVRVQFECVQWLTINSDVCTVVEYPRFNSCPWLFKSVQWFNTVTVFDPRWLTFLKCTVVEARNSPSNPIYVDVSKKTYENAGSPLLRSCLFRAPTCKY
jgi:hypothetical protein